MSAPGRPVSTPAPVVTLREITADTVRAVTQLTVAENQKGFVAPNAVSLAQALFAPEAWYRAIYVGEELAGFVMLEDESLLSPSKHQPEVGVWRFMIDARYQGRGIGRAALLQVIEHVRRKGLFTHLQLSYVPGPGCPEPFYLSLGFRHTGRVDEDEIVLELPLAEGAAAAPRHQEAAVAPSYRTPSDIHPSLTYADAAAAIDWLCRAFGFTKRLIVPGSEGRIEHSELSLGTGVVMVSSPKPDAGRFSRSGPEDLPGRSSGLSVFVEDPDAHHAAAIAAGATLVRPLQTEDYGARGYMVRDPEGHLWYFGNYRPGEYWES